VIAGIGGTNHTLWRIESVKFVLSGLIGMAVLILVMIKIPLANAGSPDEPAPPAAIM